MIQEKIEAAAARMIEAYPQTLEVTAVVENGDVTFHGKVYTIEGPYEITGARVALDEVVALPANEIAALALMRSLIG